MNFYASHAHPCGSTRLRAATADQARAPYLSVGHFVRSSPAAGPIAAVFTEAWRTCSGSFGRLRRLFGLRIVPDHSSLWRFAYRHLSPEQIEAALRETVQWARCSSKHASQVALDSTSLWLSHTSQYFTWLAQRHRRQRGWLKWPLAIWIEPQMLLAQRVSPEPACDFSNLVPLAS